MCEVDDCSSCRGRTETFNGDDVDRRQTVCGVHDEICVTRASLTRHGKFDGVGSGPVEPVEGRGGPVADHRMLTEHEEAPPELELVCTWSAGNSVRSGPDTLEPATSKELAALPVSRRVGAQLGVSDQPVLIPCQRCNLLIHISQWGRLGAS